MTGIFPFGERVHDLAQLDRSPKRVFVLGKYASAVHARWIGADGTPKVYALAVASEPEIFWRGDGVEEILARIPVPEEAGKLVPAASMFNGPSGIALDQRFIEPLGLTRKDAWLCDLVPRSFMNPKQKKALEREYIPLMEQCHLPKPSIPPVPSQLADDQRRQEILEEIRESRAGVLILLGDEPIKWFLRRFDDRWARLGDFGETEERYGRLHESRLDDMTIRVLPLVHPRQAAALGTHSRKWFELHQHWVREVASSLIPQA
jgi:uracil-DNA glycosylase